MNEIKDVPEKLEKRMKRSARQLFIWTSGWVLSLALLAFGPKFLWDFATNISLAVIALNLFFGYKMILAHKRHLDDMDEMQRAIQFNAMAISLGVSMVFGAIYGLLDAIKLMDHSPNPSNILFVMGISYGISVFFGYRRYA